MKQHITVEQLNELTSKEKDEFRKWWKPRDLPLLSIGQMIEFLKEHCNDLGIEYRDSAVTWDVWWGEQKTPYKRNNPYGDDELCDALWGAVKECLS